MPGSRAIQVSRFRVFRRSSKDFEALFRATSDMNEDPGEPLLADAEFRDDGLIALGIVFLEVVEQATALADQHEKPAA